jgi:hypothetical protein
MVAIHPPMQLRTHDNLEKHRNCIQESRPHEEEKHREEILGSRKESSAEDEREPAGKD